MNIIVKVTINAPIEKVWDAYSYKFTAVCGFFAAVWVMIFWLIDWQVCGVDWQ